MDDDVRALERAVAATPDDGQARVGLARALDRAGRLVEAVRLLDEVATAEGRALADGLWRRLLRRLRRTADLGPRELDDPVVSGDGRLVGAGGVVFSARTGDGLVDWGVDVPRPLQDGLAGCLYELTGGRLYVQAVGEREGSIDRRTCPLPRGWSQVVALSPALDRALGVDRRRWSVVPLGDEERPSVALGGADVGRVDAWVVDWSVATAFALARGQVLAWSLDAPASPPRTLLAGKGLKTLRPLGGGAVAVPADRHLHVLAAGRAARRLPVPRDASPDEVVPWRLGDGVRWLDERVFVTAALDVGSTRPAWPGSTRIHPFADLAAVGERFDPRRPAVVAPDEAAGERPGETVVELPGPPRTWLPDGLGLILERDERLEVWRCD